MLILVFAIGAFVAIATFGVQSTAFAQLVARDPRQVGLEGKHEQVGHEAQMFAVVAGDAGGPGHRQIAGLELGRCAVDPPLDLADAREVFIDLAPVEPAQPTAPLSPAAPQVTPGSVAAVTPASNAICWRQGVAPTSWPVFKSCKLLLELHATAKRMAVPLAQR